MDVRRTLPCAFSTDVDGRFVAGDRCCNNFRSRARACGRLWFAESQTVGQDSSDHRGDSCSDQISHWHSARYLYPMGAGTGSLWARIRRDCRPKLSPSRWTRDPAMFLTIRGSRDGPTSADFLDPSAFTKSPLFFVDRWRRSIVYRRLEGRFRVPDKGFTVPRRGVRVLRVEGFRTQ